MTSSGDWLRRFHLPHAGARGVIARIDRTWREVRARSDSPPPVATALGQTLVASALFAGNIKMAGSVALQLQAGRELTLLYAECSAEGELRGVARWDGEISHAVRPAQLGPGAVLAITLESAQNGQRYQGMVPLAGDTLAQAFEGYFLQSEQLPTALHLAASGDACTGMLVQQVPQQGGSGGGDEYERIALLFRTLSDAELMALPAETLLRRLFAEDDVQLADPVSLRAGCRCSRERVIGMLRTLGRDEALAAHAEQGRLEVRCEFCDRAYSFDLPEIEELFGTDASTPGPERRQ